MNCEILNVAIRSKQAVSISNLFVHNHDLIETSLHHCSERIWSECSDDGGYCVKRLDEVGSSGTS